MRHVALLLALAASPALANETECVDFSQHITALKPLEPKALSGALDQAMLMCLEMGYLNAASQTDKAKISRVLMANAYVTNTVEWARLVKRHLDEVEQSDPDIGYLYANYLFNKRDPDYRGAVRYAELAYERRADQWEGEVFTTRSHHLLRLRTYAKIKLWEQTEKDAIAGSPDAMTRAADLRTQAHTAAREWLDFDRVSRSNWLPAAEACVATGGEQACGLRGAWRTQAGG
jgi:hypothetical protein